jgi:hypothetical protein
VINNIDGEKIDLDFDHAARVHLMNVMTDIYEDRPMAVLREYSCNARDAHIEAGVTEPIQVTLPTRIEPTITIRDFGKGLDLTEIREVYSKYGASTKRDSNDQIGAFGLGSKAGLTYSNQFTVTSVKAGRKHQMIVHRDATGASSITVTTGDEGQETDERSGVEITVPTKRYDFFESEARKLFRFWPEGTVLVNGEAPERVDGMWLSDKLVLTHTGSNASFIVMGGVPYPILPADAHNPNQAAQFETLSFKEGNSLVAFVEIGTVEPMFSREKLHVTPETKATIKRVEDEFIQQAASQVQREIDKASSTWQAITVAQEWHGKVPASARANEYTFKSKKMPKEFRLEQKDGHARNTFLVVPQHSHANKLKESSKDDKLAIESWPQVAWITNYGDTQWTPTKKKKLNAWENDQDFTPRRYIILKGELPKIVKDWIDPQRVVDWSKINAIKLARSAVGGGGVIGGRIPGSYDMYVSGDYEPEQEADVIDTSNPIFYYVGRPDEALDYAKALALVHEDCTVVTFFSNRKTKFLRNFPMAKSVHDGIHEVAKTWWDSISKRDKLTLKITKSGDHDELLELDPERIHDPKLRMSARIARRDVKAIVNQADRFYRISRWMPQDDELKWTSPLERYPLVELVSEASSYSYRIRRKYEDQASEMKTHIYTYINAAYAEGLTVQKGN